jgi:hypothetical protein
MTAADTQTHAWTEALDRDLAGLLAGAGRGLGGGAELEVTQQGRVVLVAPLARHHRVDDAGVIWVRPILGGQPADGTRPGQPPFRFDLELARRRGLRPLAARRDGAELVLELPGGETARIRPASGPRLAELRRWDTWLATVPSAELEADLDGLASDPAFAPTT